jgi:hypothetical protein
MKKGLCLLLISAGFVFADLPKFEDAGLIEAGGSLIDHIFPSPCVYDWNGDGKKDLIVGQFSSGKVNLYINSGTNSEPVLDAPTFLKAGVSDITLSGS